MKTKLLILSAIFTLFSCNKSEQKIEESAEIEKIDSVAKKESPESEIPKELIKAPDFSLADINGKRFDLSDFKGKYVYMDIWATWCGPCKVQIPFMKELEKQFHDAPIHFVSVSLDKLEDKPIWEKMVRENQMSGVQLFAGREDNFGFDYKIEYIPTFIILDKEGNIMIDRAPAPMDYQTGEINQQLVDIFKMMK
ncbi:TlpA family protein disulfide reductase [Empedobacter falsenii]|uniref:TlpA family protein disulfide reductase n=1 Tax=Empedobacter falsenii TaxID=343874 RepID=UPI002578CCE9|nr:TlpA disulfide reductase family protein [Empedobacter falsenii]MDM1298078.1 TlpA family protein disulfide reductase [Empedobacter falsenii]MDM1317847.1 TlpA family protein disulfide reductase [Empedobacter falsenii]